MKNSTKLNDLNDTQTNDWTPDPKNSGLLRDFYGNARFAGSGVRAFAIDHFGRLPLPEGHSVLAEPLHVEMEAGGNNHSRWAIIPAGTEVFFKTTPGIWNNLLWSSVYPR